MATTTRTSSRRYYHGAPRYLVFEAVVLLVMGSSTTLVDAFGGLPLGFIPEFPPAVNLRAAVLTNTVPLAWYDENYTIYDNNDDPDYFNDNGTRKEEEQYPEYRGVQADLLRHLIVIAKELDNVTLTFDLEQAPPFSYDAQFEYLANDCGYTSNEYTNFEVLSEEDCNRLDLVIGDYYGFPTRSIRTLLTPSFLTTAGATMQYIYRRKRVITTLQEAQTLGEPVCLLDESHFDKTALELYPDLLVQRCSSHDECLRLLKDDSCALFVEDQLQLRHFATEDATLSVTPESFNENLILWPISARLDPLIQQLIIRWMYQAKVTGVLEELDKKYFSVHTCPLGLAGPDCDQPCDATHGIADRYGNCLCDSTRWTGEDCSIEVIEDRNLIPSTLKIISYVMLGINYLGVAICGVWLFWNRNTAQVKVAQPTFLCLVLMGCVISTSTIMPLAAEDEGNLLPGEKHSDGYGKEELSACMAIPWLYSVGFSLTVGSLFAKIRRVYLLFHAAATMQRVSVTATETFYIVGVILLTDVIILTVWTVMDPLYWYREPVLVDKYGHALSSEGHCVSDHFVIFGSVLLAFHFTIMGLACYQCYLAREIPTKFSEGKYVTIAMISNLQIFIVATPVLIILGTDPQTSFFVRSVIIWMNDFVVLVLIFGNLMYSVHGEQMDNSNRKYLIRQAMSTYQGRRNMRKSTFSGQRSTVGGFNSYAGPTPSLMSYAQQLSDSCFDASSMNLQPSNHQSGGRKTMTKTAITVAAGSMSAMSKVRELEESESSSSSSSSGDSFRNEGKSAELRKVDPPDKKPACTSEPMNNASTVSRSARRTGIMPISSTTQLPPPAADSSGDIEDPSDSKEVERASEHCPNSPQEKYPGHDRQNSIPNTASSHQMNSIHSKKVDVGIERCPDNSSHNRESLASQQHRDQGRTHDSSASHPMRTNPIDSKVYDGGGAGRSPPSSTAAQEEFPGHDRNHHAIINNFQDEHSVASSLSASITSSGDSIYRSAHEDYHSPPQSTSEIPAYRDELYFT